MNLRRRLFLFVLTLALALPVVAEQPPAQQAPAAEAEHHITKEEAQALFHSIDEILKFASDQTGLPILHPVKKKLATRKEVASYVAKRLKEQGNAERFDRTALPLKKLGLLPRDFNLRQYMLDLYKEQVEGWYDAHNKTVYLLDWVSPETQKPVMAHELVHALQDQSFGLEGWLNVAKDSKDATAQIAIEEQRVARESVVEGQAMAVLNAYQLANSGSQTPSTANKGEDSTPVYSHAPLYLREAMLFPYSYGLEFVRFVQEKSGKEAAFAGVFRRPPADTRQIMQPATYLSAEPQPETKVLPVEDVLGSGWQREDVDGIGEIDLQIMLQQWAGDEIASRLTQAWRGGYYVSLSKKDAPKGTPISLVMVVPLSSPATAGAFARIYSATLATRYKSVQPVSEAGIEPASAPAHRTLLQWITDEGLISLYVEGSTVIALESFSSVEAAKLHAAIVQAPLAATATTF